MKNVFPSFWYFFFCLGHKKTNFSLLFFFHVLFFKTHRKWEKKKNEISQYLTEYPTCDLQYHEFKEKKHLEIKKQILENKLGDLQKNRDLQRKLRAMNQILRRLGYTNTESKLNLKGCVACEISSGNELVATELLFHGVSFFLFVSEEKFTIIFFFFVFLIFNLTQISREKRVFSSKKK